MKYALEKQNTKKVSQGKLRCYGSKFHGVNIADSLSELRGASKEGEEITGPQKGFFLSCFYFSPIILKVDINNYRIKYNFLKSMDQIFV